MLTCIYKCRECNFEWEAYRIMLDKYNNPVKLTGPGMTVCPKCHHDKIKWLNYEKFKDNYLITINDGGCGKV